jgi:hypothetical protein
LAGDRLPEQGFVRVFELDDRVFYHQGQGVELLGDLDIAIFNWWMPSSRYPSLSDCYGIRVV